MKKTRRMERRPTGPGEILAEEFLAPLGLTQKQLADHVGCDVKVINRLINGRTALSVELAVKLSAVFRTTADFWLNAQKAVDLYDARLAIQNMPGPLIPATP
jgi:addiction module HigA family antidote